MISLKKPNLSFICTGNVLKDDFGKPMNTLEYAHTHS